MTSLHYLPVIPAKAGIQTAFDEVGCGDESAWIPAFAGMTKKGLGSLDARASPSTMLRMVPLPVPGRIA
jgi:hypothetical protein